MSAIGGPLARPLGPPVGGATIGGTTIGSSALGYSTAKSPAGKGLSWTPPNSGKGGPRPGPPGFPSVRPSGPPGGPILGAPPPPPSQPRPSGPGQYGAIRPAVAPVATSSPYGKGDGKSLAARPPRPQVGIGMINTFRAPMVQASPNSVVLLGAGALAPGMEKEIEEAARQVCIQNGFSCCEEVRFVSSSLAYIDFPYAEAASNFLNSCLGQLKVRQKVFKLQAPNANRNKEVAQGEDGDEVMKEPEEPERPTDSLMVRQIGELGEQRILKAFQAVVPSVKGVRMMMDRKTNKSKGFCFVSFYSVSEADTAKSRMIAQGSMIDGRKVAIGFAKPQTHEQMLESDMSWRNEQNNIQAQAKQALSGVNADMWASYMQFCDEEKDREEQVKANALASAHQALAAKRAALEAKAAQAALGDQQPQPPQPSQPPLPHGGLDTGAPAGGDGGLLADPGARGCNGGPGPVSGGNTGAPGGCSATAPASGMGGDAGSGGQGLLAMAGGMTGPSGLLGLSGSAPRPPNGHQPNLLSMTSLGGLMPGLMPGMMGLPGLPPLMGLSGLSGLPGLPGLGGKGMPSMPGLPLLPGMANLTHK